MGKHRERLLRLIAFGFQLILDALSSEPSYYLFITAKKYKSWIGEMLKPCVGLQLWINQALWHTPVISAPGRSERGESEVQGHGLARWCKPLIPTEVRDLCEFETSLLYITSSRTTRDT